MVKAFDTASGTETKRVAVVFECGHSTIFNFDKALDVDAIGEAICLQCHWPKKIRQWSEIA